MTFNRRDFVLAGSALMGGIGSALAQDPYPSRPIRLIAPFPPGSSDAIARRISEHVARSIGQPIVIETRPGAQGTLGTRMAAKSKGDGYTLAQGSNSTHAAAPYLFTDPGYDPVKDFVPIARWTLNPLLLVVHADVPARSLDEFIRYAKSRGGKLSYGVGNTGGLVCCQMLKQMAGFEAEAINYQGTSQAVVDFIAGRLDFMVTDPMIVAPYLNSGKIRILGITSRQRLTTMPDVVPLHELGLTGFEYASWIGLFAPAGLPTDIQQMLNKAYVAAVRDPGVDKFLSGLGVISAPQTIDEFTLFLREQGKVWGKLIKDSGLKPQ